MRVANNLVLPLIGTAMAGIPWSFLHTDVLIAGIVWAAIGLIYAFVLRRVTGRSVADVALDENASPADSSHEPVPATS